MTVGIKAFTAIETALTERLMDSWRVLAFETFRRVKEAVERGNYQHAVKIANEIDLAVVVRRNREQMKMTAYNALLFGAARITKHPRDTVIMRDDFTRVVNDAVKTMEMTIKLNAEEKVRDALLQYVYEADIADPRTPFSNLSKQEWVKKYNRSQPQGLARMFKWDEDQHPRGKTTEGTNDGSFAPAEGGSSDDTEEKGPWAGKPVGQYAQEHGNDREPPVEEILSTLEPEARAEYDKAVVMLDRAMKRGQFTNMVHSNKDQEGYTEKRMQLHEKIRNEFLTGSENFYPEDVVDMKPTVMFLGGRGGSGKTGFQIGQSSAGVYDPKKFLVIDSDKIKEMLAKADGHDGIGWRAPLYHEESSYIASQLENIAMARGMNVVIDQTLKSNKSAMVKAFRDRGYRTEGHYMYLPREVAALRSVQRYASGLKKNGVGRLVPPEVILGNKDNEKNFDAMIPLFDNWSVWDNNVARGKGPKLIKRKGG